MAESRPISVLVVNDNLSVCWLWERVINRAPKLHCVGYALNADQAVEMAIEHKPDIVLMDVVMPGPRDGYDATRLIREQLPQTRVIIHSAHVNTREKAISVGADDYLLMPITPGQLIAAIREVAARSTGSTG